jgi:hypothetical protein
MVRCSICGSPPETSRRRPSGVADDRGLHSRRAISVVEHAAFDERGTYRRRAPGKQDAPGCGAIVRRRVLAAVDRELHETRRLQHRGSVDAFHPAQLPEQPFIE